MKMRKRLIALLLVVAMVLSMAAPALAATPSDTGSLPADVKADIQRLIDAGILSGYPDGTFKPDGTLTRGDYAKYVVNAAGLKEEKPATPTFKDAGASMANYGFIEAAAKAKIIQGFPDGTYRPTDNITKGQAAAIALRVMGKGTGTYAGDIKAAIALGLLESAAVSSQTATRAQAAVVIVDTGLVPATPKAASITITSSATTDNIAKGSSIKLTAAVKDASGNAVAGAQVTWSADKGVIAADGTYAATAAGAVTITAKSGDISATKAITVFGAATKLQASVAAELAANNKSNTTVTIKAVDADGNVDTNYVGTITVDPSAELKAGTAAKDVAITVKADKGVATVTVTAQATAGTETVSVSATGLTGAIANVKVNAQKLTSVKISADPPSIAADGSDQTTLTLTANDQEGVQMLAIPGGLNAKLTLSATTAAAFDTGATKDTATFNAAGPALTATTAIGTTTVSGVITAPADLTGVPVTGLSVNTIIVGVPNSMSVDAVSDVTAGTAQAIVARVKDANGNQVTSATAGVTALKISINNAAAVAMTDAGNGKWTYNNAATATAGTITYKITGTYTTGSAITLPAVTTSGKVNPGAATQITLNATPDTILASGLAQATLTATVKDANGNKVTSGTYAVTFTKLTTGTPAATQALADTVVNTVDGVATIKVTSTTTTGTSNFRVTNTTLGTADAAVTTAIFGQANQLGITAVSNAAPTAGTEVTVTVKVFDATGAATVTTDNGRTITITAKDKATGTAVGTFTGTTTDGIASIKVNLTKKATYNLEATAEGLVKGTMNDAIVVASNTASALTLKSDLSTLAANGSVAALTLGLVDQYGNVVAAGSQAVNLTASVAGIGTLTDAVYTLSSGAGVTSYTTSTTPGSVTITASSTGLTSASVTLTSIVVGAASKLVVETISDTVADNVKTQTVKVTVLDANGNRVTSDNGRVITLTETSSATITDDTMETVKGQSTFTVKSAVAEEVTYTATAGGLTAATGKGKFIAGAAAGVTVAASPATILGNGSTVSNITVKVVDATGNLVSAANGTATLEVTAGNAAFLIGAADNGKLSVQITNGVGSAMLQAKDLTMAAGNGTATITATFKISNVDQTNTVAVTVTKP
ncbi:MAG: S-layer homology domain-containing protein [Bacillota bacterium]